MASVSGILLQGLGLLLTGGCLLYAADEDTDQQQSVQEQHALQGKIRLMKQFMWGVAVYVIATGQPSFTGPTVTHECTLMLAEGACCSACEASDTCTPSCPALLPCLLMMV